MNIWRKWWLIEHGLWPAPKPPAPPPVVRSRWKIPPWAGLGVHVAWAFTSGTRTGSYSPDQLVDRLHNAGFKWAAIEGSPALDNEAFFLPFADALHARGMKAILWERADVQKDYPESRIDHVKRLINTYPFDAYGADIDTFPIDTPDFPKQFANAFPNMPRVTLDAGLEDAGYYKTWIEADFDFMTQAYSGPLGKPPVPGVAGSMDSDVKWRMIGAVGHEILNWLGLHTVPILEVNSENSAPLKDQLPAVALWGSNFSIWDVESMTDDDFNTAAHLT